MINFTQCSGIKVIEIRQESTLDITQIQNKSDCTEFIKWYIKVLIILPFIKLIFNNSCWRGRK